MFCRKPFVKEGYAYGCGQCIPCRVNRRRVWVHRIMLEAQLSSDNAFITLSYDDEHLPSDGSLNPADLVNFMRRLKRHAGRTVRYYGVGEYGDRTNRPHYHAALFGTPSCCRGVSNFRLYGGKCCDICHGYRTIWGQGHVYIGQLEPKSAAYVAGYIAKAQLSEEQLDGRHPEFSRMSNRPGIGCDMMDEVASDLLQGDYEKWIGDVPESLRHGGVKWPLGRYLRRKLRERIGRAPESPKAAFEKMDKEMQLLREAAKANAPKGFYQETLRGLVIDVGEGKRKQLEGREKFRAKKGML